MKKQVIDFFRNEIKCGREVLVSVEGWGDNVLELNGDEPLVDDLELLPYVDGIPDPGDFIHYKPYNANEYRIHRFNAYDGLYVLVATYMTDVDVCVDGVPNARITEDEEYYFIDFGDGVSHYEKKDWLLDKAIEDKLKGWRQ